MWCVLYTLFAPHSLSTNNIVSDIYCLFFLTHVSYSKFKLFRKIMWAFSITDRFVLLNQRWKISQYILNNLLNSLRYCARMSIVKITKLNCLWIDASCPAVSKDRDSYSLNKVIISHVITVYGSYRNV